MNRLACPVLLGTQFLDYHVEAIRCKERTLYLTRSIIPILGVGDATAPLQEPPASRRTPAANSESKPIGTVKPPKDASIRLCKSLRLPPFTQVKAQVITQSGGLVHTEPRPSVYQQYQVRGINGVHEVVREEPFDLLLSTFSRVERHLSKGMVVAYAAPSPLALIPLLGPAGREMSQVLNIAPLEDGAAKAAPLTQDDTEQAAPDFDVKTRVQGVERDVGPVTSQHAPALP